MLPEEAQALMAKMLLIIFGTVLLCLSKVRAQDISSQLNPQKISSQTIALKK